MIEMNSVDEEGGAPLNKIGDINIEKKRCECCMHKKKMYIIIGVTAAFVVTLVVVLCVYLIKKSKRNYNNNITLSVYSDNDDKEISFISNDFNIDESFIKNENITMLIDDSKYSFIKSKKLKKGEHKIIISFDDIFKYCQSMFKNCKDITGINFNMTGYCNNIEYMFNGCSSLKKLNFIKINTSKANNMEEMFNGCNSLENIDLNLFETNSVTNMKRMFNGCKNLKYLDLHNFDTTYVTNMEEMFNECNSIKKIKFNRNSNYKLEYGKFIPFDTYNVINMKHIFYACNSLQSIDVSNFV